LIFFLIGILIWLIPTCIVNGFVDYFRVLIKYFLWISGESGTSIFFIGSLFRRLNHQFTNFYKFFLGSGYGISLSEPNILSVIFLLVFLSYILLSYWRLKDKKMIFFIAGLLFYFLYTFFFLPVHNPRYFLPLIPFISLLLAFGVSWFNKYDYIAFIFLVFILLIGSVPLAKTIHKVPSPPVQLINYIEANYDLEGIVVFKDIMSKAHLEYYGIPAYPSFNLERYLSNETISDKFSFDKNQDISTTFKANKIILIINPDYFTFGNYNLGLIKEFKRDVRVHAKQDYISLYELRYYEIKD
jgi:hypothetical protein